MRKKRTNLSPRREAWRWAALLLAAGAVFLLALYTCIAAWTQGRAAGDNTIPGKNAPFVIEENYAPSAFSEGA